MSNLSRRKMIAGAAALAPALTPASAFAQNKPLLGTPRSVIIRLKVSRCTRS